MRMWRSTTKTHDRISMSQHTRHCVTVGSQIGNTVETQVALWSSTAPSC
ncbi:hypothetical protein HMPREF9057_02274 [Actinomyces sp. oral taxon 171 str. F0337]|nr:hypothetical protein HMPREF9057_02274 [Actinomyces sp. oral taxon 171 str. F0337]